MMRLSDHTIFPIDRLIRQRNTVTDDTLVTLLDAFQLPTDEAVESNKRRFRELDELEVDALTVKVMAYSEVRTWGTTFNAELNEGL